MSLGFEPETTDLHANALTIVLLKINVHTSVSKGG